MFHRSVAYLRAHNEFLFHTELTGDRTPKQTFIKMRYRTKGKFTSFCRKICDSWVLQFYVVCLFPTQSDPLSQSDKIHIAGNGSRTLPEMHTLLAFLCVLLPRVLQWWSTERDTTQNDRISLMLVHLKHYGTLWQGMFFSFTQTSAFQWRQKLTE